MPTFSPLSSLFIFAYAACRDVVSCQGNRRFTAARIPLALFDDEGRAADFLQVYKERWVQRHPGSAHLFSLEPCCLNFETTDILLACLADCLCSLADPEPVLAGLAAGEAVEALGRVKVYVLSHYQSLGSWPPEGATYLHLELRLTNFFYRRGALVERLRELGRRRLPPVFRKATLYAGDGKARPAPQPPPRGVILGCHAYLNVYTLWRILVRDVLSLHERLGIVARIEEELHERRRRKF